jgi:hypothetical protein
MNEEAMKPKQRIDRKRKTYGPNIVRAWFDTVFQYALRGLEAERNLLVHRSWTFRFRKRAFEYLAPLAEHLPSEARENLEQFQSFFPEVATRIDAHDNRERQLETSCNAYLDALLKSPDFQQVFHSVAKEAPRTLGREFSSYFGAYSEGDSMGVLAEYVVNNVETLASHYSTAEVWNHYRGRFLEVASTPALTTFREEVEKSSDAMLKAVDNLTASLKTTRSELSLEFDVPYVAEVNSVR